MDAWKEDLKSLDCEDLDSVDEDIEVEDEELELDVERDQISEEPIQDFVTDAELQAINADKMEKSPSQRNATAFPGPLNDNLINLL